MPKITRNSAGAMGRTRARAAALGCALLLGGLPVRAESVAPAALAEKQAPKQLAEQLRQRAAARSAATLKQLDQARRAGDPAHRCLNDLLTQLNSTRRDIDQRAERLARALAADRRVDAEHETMVLRYLQRRLERLDQDTTSCKPRAARNTTTVEVSIRAPQPEHEPAEL